MSSACQVHVNISCQVHVKNCIFVINYMVNDMLILNFNFLFHIRLIYVFMFVLLRVYLLTLISNTFY